MAEPTPTEAPTVAFLRSRLNTLRGTFTQYTVTDYIRLVAIIGAYSLIIRPLLMKIGAKYQAKDHEREVDHDGAADSMAASGVKQQVVNEDDDDEHDDEEDEDEAWGAKKRRDQRAARRRRKKALAAGEELDGSDKEIEQYLVD